MARQRPGGLQRRECALFKVFIEQGFGDGVRQDARAYRRRCPAQDIESRLRCAAISSGLEEEIRCCGDSVVGGISLQRLEFREEICGVAADQHRNIAEVGLDILQRVNDAPRHYPGVACQRGRSE